MKQEGWSQERRGQVWMDGRRREVAGGRAPSPQHPVEPAVSHICMRAFAQEEQIGVSSWSQAQNDNPLPREAIKR